MTESWAQALQSEDLNTRAATVSQLANVPAELRDPLFQIVAGDTCNEIRRAAAELILICPTAFQYFLADQDSKIQTIIVATSVEIRRNHPEPATVLALLTNPSFFRAVAADVRYAIGSVIADHVKLEENETVSQTVAERIAPVVELYMKDSDDGVRLAISKSVNEIGKYFGIEFALGHFHNAFHRMLTDSQWRVRVNAIELLYGLAIVSPLEFFEAHLFDFIIKFLKDDNHRVRHFTLSGIPQLADRFGTEWVIGKLVPQLRALASSPNYIQRETFLLAISLLVKYFPERRRANLAFQPMIKLLSDDVNSVVLVALIVLVDVSGQLHPFRVDTELRPLLEGLVSGGAPTVKALATAFLQRLPS
jgi:HEAT repeat protein